MKNIIVNGRTCRLSPFGDRPVVPGAIIGQLYGRRVYRVLCFDGDDVIARNVRHEDIIEAFGYDEVLDEFGLVEVG